jgi:hypothetical protein
VYFRNKLLNPLGQGLTLSVPMRSLHLVLVLILLPFLCCSTPIYDTALPNFGVRNNTFVRNLSTRIEQASVLHSQIVEDGTVLY